MIKIDRQKVASNKLPIALMFAELIMAMLLVYLFYKIAGLEFDLEQKVLSFVPNFDPTLFLFFALSAGLFVLLYFAIKKKAPGLFEAQALAQATIKDKAVEKVKLVKTDTRAAALLLIEFSFVVMVAMTIVAWLDPQIEMIPWSNAGIGPPLTTALNGIIALAMLAFFYYIYSFTAWYRKK